MTWNENDQNAIDPHFLGTAPESASLKKKEKRMINNP
jgi:hypothetical protein